VIRELLLIIQHKDVSVDSFQPDQPSCRLPPHPLHRDVYRAPSATTLDKVAEGVRLTYIRSKVKCQKSDRSNKPISKAGKFSNTYVVPLDHRHGKNERIMLGKWAPTIDICDGIGGKQTVIQAASHNYAGFYRLSQEAEDLHRTALDGLPVAGKCATPSLEAAMHKELAGFFSADFCYTTSTGYGSNLLAFSAILDQDWLVLLDDKCHNSSHIAAFQSNAGSVKKFPHGEYTRMESILENSKDKFANILVAVEGFYRSAICPSQCSAINVSVAWTEPCLDSMFLLASNSDTISPFLWTKHIRYCA
jgi:serine palmitoyltransferase